MAELIYRSHGPRLSLPISAVGYQLKPGQIGADPVI